MEAYALDPIFALLVQYKYISLAQAQRCQTIAKESNCELLQVLTQQHPLDSSILAGHIAQHFRLPLLDPQQFPLENIPLQLINAELIYHHQVLPLAKENNKLYLAIDNPYKLSAITAIQFDTGLICSLVVADTHLLRAWIHRVYHMKSVAHLNHIAPAPLSPQQSWLLELQHLESSIDEEPLVKFVAHLIDYAICMQASDIHFEIYQKQCRIRIRMDGILHAICQPNLTVSLRIINRLKVMAQLDIAERRLPMDGYISFNDNIDLRISTCPTLYGEKIVLRILYAQHNFLNLHSLGLNTNQYDIIQKTIQKPQGLILVTGPTGSGKTSTLYTILQSLNKESHNILSVEDPIEIKLPGINQVNVNDKIGLSFSKVLRAFLRQDPDIIFIGEIRDYETAEIAIKAAQTGHLVLSTLHTHRAVDAIARLTNLGISRNDLSHTLHLVIAQRLVRKICLYCQQTRNPKTATFCGHCIQGYKGRTGIFEVLEMSPSLIKGILSTQDTLALQQQAEEEGMQDLQSSALEKITQGITDAHEIQRILGNVPCTMN